MMRLMVASIKASAVSGRRSWSFFGVRTAECVFDGDG
jgi:hypothetical protein